MVPLVRKVARNAVSLPATDLYVDPKVFEMSKSLLFRSAVNWSHALMLVKTLVLTKFFADPVCLEKVVHPQPHLRYTSRRCSG